MRFWFYRWLPRWFITVIATFSRSRDARELNLIAAAVRRHDMVICHTFYTSGCRRRLGVALVPRAIEDHWPLAAFARVRGKNVVWCYETVPVTGLVLRHHGSRGTYSLRRTSKRIAIVPPPSTRHFLSCC